MPSRALEVSVDGIGADVGAVEALVDEVGAFGERGPHDAAGGRGRRRRSRRRRGGRRRGRRRSAPASAPEQARRQRPDENNDLSPRAVGAVLVVLLHDSSFLPGRRAQRYQWSCASSVLVTRPLAPRHASPSHAPPCNACTARFGAQHKRTRAFRRRAVLSAVHAASAPDDSDRVGTPRRHRLGPREAGPWARILLLQSGQHPTSQVAEGVVLRTDLKLPRCP